MAKSTINYRKATFKDVNQISSVLMDFYNMKDANEASEHLYQKWKKIFIILLQYKMML